MKYAGKVYCADLFVGTIFANSITVLKRKASTMCNRYHKVVDSIVIHRVDGNDVNGLRFTRINRLSPNSEIIRGIWK